MNTKNRMFVLNTVFILFFSFSYSKLIGMVQSTSTFYYDIDTDVVSSNPSDSSLPLKEIPTSLWIPSILKNAIDTLRVQPTTRSLGIEFQQEGSNAAARFQKLVFDITDKDLYRIIIFSDERKKEIAQEIKDNLTRLQNYINNHYIVDPQETRETLLNSVKKEIDKLVMQPTEETSSLEASLQRIAYLRNKILAIAFVIREQDLLSYLFAIESRSLSHGFSITKEIFALENKWPDDIGGRILYILGKDWDKNTKEAILQLLFFNYSQKRIEMSCSMKIQ